MTGKERGNSRDIQTAAIAHRGAPDVRECFDEQAISDFIVWNAPDHEYTRRALRSQLEREIDELFAVYEVMGGDGAATS